MCEHTLSGLFHLRTCCFGILHCVPHAEIGSELVLWDHASTQLNHLQVEMQADRCSVSQVETGPVETLKRQRFLHRPKLTIRIVPLLPLPFCKCVGKIANQGKPVESVSTHSKASDAA